MIFGLLLLVLAALFGGAFVTQHIYNLILDAIDYPAYVTYGESFHITMWVVGSTVVVGIVRAIFEELSS